MKIKTTTEGNTIEGDWVIEIRIDHGQYEEESQMMVTLISGEKHLIPVEEWKNVEDSYYANQTGKKEFRGKRIRR